MSASVSTWALARDDRPAFIEGLEAGATQHPGRAAALWLLTEHGRWIDDPAFIDSCQTNADRSCKVQWSRVARAVIASDAPDYDIAIGLAACRLAGNDVIDAPPPDPIGKPNRLGILERDGYVCAYCGDYADTMDHVLPIARGGRTSWQNLVAACRSCNEEKGCQLLENLGWSLRVRRTEWTSARMKEALGPVGSVMVWEAEGLRDALAADLEDAMRAAISAALTALHAPVVPDEWDGRHRALLRELSDRLLCQTRQPLAVGA